MTGCFLVRKKRAASVPVRPEAIAHSAELVTHATGLRKVPSPVTTRLNLIASSGEYLFSLQPDAAFLPLYLPACRLPCCLRGEARIGTSQGLRVVGKLTARPHEETLQGVAGCRGPRPAAIRLVR